MTKSAQNCGFGHLYLRNRLWKTSFFMQCNSYQSFQNNWDRTIWLSQNNSHHDENVFPESRSLKLFNNRNYMGSRNDLLRFSKLDALLNSYNKAFLIISLIHFWKWQMKVLHRDGNNSTETNHLSQLNYFQKILSAGSNFEILKVARVVNIKLGFKDWCFS